MNKKVKESIDNLASADDKIRLAALKIIGMGKGNGNNRERKKVSNEIRGYTPSQLTLSKQMHPTKHAPDW